MPNHRATDVIAASYNYVSFPLDMQESDFEAFPNFMHVGASATDGVLINAESGEEVRLSDLWQNGSLVIEFGSIT